MDTRHLTIRLVADLDPRARPVVTEYLQDLAAALPASHRTRAAILTEIADGLIEQITDTPGTDAATVARAAIHTFGSPRHLATQFARELTGKTAHHTGVGLVVSGPMVGAAWLLALTNGQPANAAHPLPERITGLFTALPLLPLLLFIAIPAALVAIAGAGRSAKALPVTTGTAGLAGLVAGTGCVIADLTLIGHVLSGGAWSPLLIAAVTISTARLILAAAAARRCARLRAAG